MYPEEPIIKTFFNLFKNYIFYLRVFFKESVVILSGKSLNLNNISIQDKNLFVINNYTLINDNINNKNLYFVILNSESLSDFFINYKINTNCKIISQHKSYLEHKFFFEKYKCKYISISLFEKIILRKIIKRSNIKTIAPNTLLVLLQCLKTFSNKKVYLYGCDGLPKNTSNIKDIYHESMDSQINFTKIKYQNIYNDQNILNKYFKPQDFKNVINCNKDSYVTCFKKL